MKAQVIVFFKKLGVTLLIVIVMDISFGKVMEYLYFKTNPGSPMQHTTFSLNAADPDILVFGSSRAQHHYSPNPFEEKLKATFYNTGKDGQGILYSWAMLKSELERSQKDKTVILDINPNEFNKEKDNYDRLSELLPYYEDEKEIRDIIHLRGPFERYKALSRLYRFNSLILPVLKNYFFPFDKEFEDGYEPLQKPVKLPKLTRFQGYETIDSLEVMAFKNFITEAKRANHKVFVYVSPSYKIYSNGTTKSLKIAHKICKEEGVPFYNYLQDSLFLNTPSYFSDATHLNEIGAEVFSEKVLYNITGQQPGKNSSQPRIRSVLN